MQIVGYQLIRQSDGAVVQSWGGTWGVCPGVPNPVRLPNGDDVWGITVGEDLSGYRLSAWLMDEPAPSEADYAAAIQQHIDATAKARSYFDAVTCASYAASSNASWKSDADAFIAWRDAVWTYVYEQLAAVQAGNRAQPNVADFIIELPAIAWP